MQRRDVKGAEQAILGFRCRLRRHLGVVAGRKMIMATRIILADNHAIIREGLCALIEKHDGMEVVGKAANGREAVTLAKELSPDVILMEASMPQLNGMDATLQILAENPAIRIIALSVHSNRQFVSEMLKAGASGYLLKTCDFKELSQAISTALAGGTYLSEAVAGIVVEDYVRQLNSKSGEPAMELSNREREVLQLLVEGKPPKQIATILHVSVKTVQSHRQHIMVKLDLYSLSELTKYAIQIGLTSVNL